MAGERGEFAFPFPGYLILTDTLKPYRRASQSDENDYTRHTAHVGSALTRARTSVMKLTWELQSPLFAPFLRTPLSESAPSGKFPLLVWSLLSQIPYQLPASLNLLEVSSLIILLVPETSPY